MVRFHVFWKGFELGTVRGLFVILTLLLSSGLATAPLAHAQTVSFEKTWGTVNDEDGYGVAVDGLGNIYVAGYKSEGDAGENDVLLLKYNWSGGLVWKMTWGGTEDDCGWGVAVDGSGNNIYVAGTTGVIVGAEVRPDLLLLKFDSSGALQWQKIWGSTAFEDGYGVAVDGSGNNIYVTGHTTGLGTGGDDLVLLKFNSSGGLVWQKAWGGEPNEAGQAVAVDGSGNSIYVTGYTWSWGEGMDDVVLLKFDSSGALQWQKTWGGAGQDYGYGVAVDASGNSIYVSGGTTSFGAGNYDVVLLKFNSSGGLVWKRTWGGTENDCGWGVAVDGSDNIYVTGWTGSFSNGYGDIVLLKLESLGSLLWEKTWGSPGSASDQGYGVAVHLSNLYFTGYIRGAVGTLNSVSGIFTTPTATAGIPTFTIGNLTFTPGEPGGTVSTPTGSETYSGGHDVFLLALTYSESPSVFRFGQDVLDASSNAAWFVLGDYVLHSRTGTQFRSSASKGSPLVAAIATDIFAGQYFYGGLSNPQNVILDTNSAYISQAPGDFGNATGISDGAIVTVGGPLVNQVVHYYMFTTNESQLFYDSAAGAIKRRDTNANVTSEATTWTSDVFVVESFVDTQGRIVYMFWGKSYLGTMASTCFIMEVLMKPTNPYADTSWFVVRWNEATSGASVNGMPDAGDTYTVIASGPSL